jgi:spore coat protein A
MAFPATHPSWIPVDTQLTPLGDQVRLMTHLHGGFVAADSDGNPMVTPTGFGPGETQQVLYTNQSPQMPASLLWFHDHGLGATRLNVFAGLAAAYILRDQFDTGSEPNPIGIPGGAYEIPLVIQDRQFNPVGTFLYPIGDIAGVTWIGEYFGDVMLVNGKVWPFVDVEPRMYRLRILNGCNARILALDIGGVALWQIGAEGGLFDMPVALNKIVLAPAERADILVDFGRFAGQTLVMKNHRPQKPVSNPAPQLEQVMKIRVGTMVSERGPTTIPSSLPGRKADVSEPVRSRFIALNEIDPGEVTWYSNLNGAHFGDSPISKMPEAGTVEDWVYIKHDR